MHITDSFFHKAENDTTLKGNYTLIKTDKKTRMCISQLPVFYSGGPGGA